MTGGVSLGNPTCGSCCFPLGACGSTADFGSNCVPRRICINTEFTPGPYFNHACGLVDPYGVCCDHINFCIDGGSNTGGCGWSGTGVCNEFCGVTISVPVDVRLVEVDGLWYTRVDSPYLDNPLDFRGILGKYRNEDGTYTTGVISWVMFDDDGNEYACEIGHNSAIHNPQMQDACGPCHCGTCLPEKLCLCLTVGGEQDCVISTCNGSRSWSTETITLPTGAYGSDEEYTISTRLPEDYETAKGCVLIVRVSGGDISSVVDGVVVGYQESLVSLESGLAPAPDPLSPVDGAICKSTSDNSLTIPDGKGYTQNPVTYRTLTVVDAAIDLMHDDGYESSSVGSLAIKDSSCGGPCRTVVCNPPGPCCDPPDTLYVSISGPLCSCCGGVITLNYSAGTDSWEGSGPVGAGGSTMVLSLLCNGSGEWSLIIRKAGCGGPIGDIDEPALLTGTPVCDPFLLTFVYSETLAAKLCCAGVHSTFMFTVTA